ncbi:sphingolipid C4-monooxygenase [Malassezia brasiliensis]|uniref:Sphingolipid C4-monooxygenase n=1 Tax=Malassezia brasiliensis TaxID=1821822 RepID=A0AAF0DV88_9BASI|nr:sphingolipid C4-monooxygenase [Malassezia brasiliensis]
MARGALGDTEVGALVRQTLPFYYQKEARVWDAISDKHLSLLLPVAIYWATSLAYHALDVLQPAWSERFRMHPPEQVAKRNRVTMRRVIEMVLLQHAMQTILGLIVLEDTPHVGAWRTDVHPEQEVLRVVNWLRAAYALVAPGGAGRAADLLLVRAGIALYWWGLPWLQFWLACFIMDAWQYALHRLMHEVRFLYRHLHSHHHRLYVPYAFGALYNHPLEGLLLDTAGAAVAQLGSLINLRQSMVFFTLSTYKTVSDHCGYAFPWYYHPIHLLFPNSAEYHDVHHQRQGLRYNYSQPFFVHFDTLLGTRMDPADFHAMLDQAKARQEGRDEDDEPRVATVALPPRARAATVDDKATARSSPYTTASAWSVVFFVGILVVPVVAYSVGPW